MNPQDQIVCLGLIGAGPWGRNFIRTIDELDGVCLARLASGNPESRNLVDAGCLVSEDWRQVANAEDLDGVIVATPPALHGEMVQTAVEAGLPVLVEKPLTLDLDEAKDLLALTESRGGLVMVDHIHLFSAPWEAFKREAENLGPVRSIVSTAGRWGPFRKDVSVLWDWGPHDIALCCDLMGFPPETIHATRTEARQTKDGPGETLELDAGFGEGVNAKITLGNLFADRKRYFRADFDSCALVYDDTSTHKLMRHNLPPQSPEDPLPVGDGTPLMRAVNSFRKAILEGSRDLTSLRLGVTVVEILSKSDKTCAE